MSNLSTKVDRIRTLASELDQLGKTSLKKAVEAGQLLSEAKADLNHGEWLPWIKSNFAFSERTAQNWISIAKAEERGDLKSATVADLGIREAIKLARPEKETTSEQLIAPSVVDYVPPLRGLVDPNKCIDVPRGFFKSVSSDETRGFFKPVPSDETRYAICGIRVDASSRRLVATDGRGLAVMDIPGDQKIVDGWISKKQWMAASATVPGSPTILLEYTKGRIGGVKYNTAGDELERFPNGETVSEIIARPVKSRDITLDYKLLNRLCISLAGRIDQAGHRVTLSIPDDENDHKVIVTVGGRTGVLMLFGDFKAEKQTPTT